MTDETRDRGPAERIPSAPDPAARPGGRAAPEPRAPSTAARRRETSDAAPGRLARLRRALYVQLEPDGWSGDALSPVNTLATLAVLASVVVAALMTEPTLDAWDDGLDAAMFGFALLFTVEFAARFWAKWESPRWRAHRHGPFGWLTRWYACIDLLALIGIWAEVATVDDLSLSVMLRLLRVLHVFSAGGDSAVARAGREIGRAVRERRLELGIAVCVAGLTLMVASVAIYAAERHVQPEIFGSIPRAMWWSVVTLTTVGYGDAVPVTVAGRMIAGLTALASVALVALPAGIMAAAFSDALQRARRRSGDHKD